MNEISGNGIGAEGIAVPQPEIESYEPYLPENASRERLAYRIDCLIDRILERSISHLVFLDSSSRPLVTLLSELWEKRRETEENMPKMPTIDFFNIGSETKVFVRSLGLDPKAEDFSDKLFDQYQSGRDQSAPDPIDYRHLADAEKGASVMIVDESEGNGFTKRTAELLIKRFYSEKDFDISTYIVEQKDAPIFGGKAGPPWKAGMVDEDYGVTGVINPTDEETFVLDKGGAFYHPKTLGFTSRSASNLTPTEHKKIVDNMEVARGETETEAIRQFIENSGSFFADLHAFCLQHKEGYSTEFQHYIDVTLYNLTAFEEKIVVLLDELKKAVAEDDHSKIVNLTDQIRTTYFGFMENFRRIANDSRLRKWWSNFSDVEINQEFLISIYVFERDASYYFSNSAFANAWEAIARLNNYRHYIQDKKSKYKDMGGKVRMLREEMKEIANEYWLDREEIRQRMTTPDSQAAK